MLQVKTLSKTFNDVLVLNQVSLEVEPNTIVGLAGPSGSGKSTLLRCIQQLESPDSGSIAFSGRCGFMFQDFQLFPHMNVLENLIYAPGIFDKTCNHEERAKALLNKLGITDKLLAHPQQLSGGQKQRVAFARSLMMQPDLLLCDEPTSGLDRSAINEVIALLHSVKDLNVTMLIASHDLAFLTQIADRMLVIKQGTFIADFKTKRVTDPISFIQDQY